MCPGRQCGRVQKEMVRYDIAYFQEWEGNEVSHYCDFLLVFQYTQRDNNDNRQSCYRDNRKYDLFVELLVIFLQERVDKVLEKLVVWSGTGI